MNRERAAPYLRLQVRGRAATQPRARALVLPAVDRQEPVGPGSVAVLLGAQESCCPAGQFAQGGRRLRRPR
jgi:hypothetical protein